MPETDSGTISSLRIQRDRFETARQTRNKRKRFVIIAVGAILLLLLIFIVMGALNPTPKVETATISMMYPAQLNRVLVASGYVVAQRQAAVASKATGRLVELNMEEGDFARRNEVIARIENGDMQAALAQAKATLEMSRAALLQAEAEMADATASFTRVTTLYNSGSISKSDFEIAEARHKRAQASVTSAKANIRAGEAAVSAAGVQLENTVIRAPFDGTVLTKNADIGEVVAPFGASANARGAVVTMADMRSLEVEADVSESNIEKVSIGQPCEITIDAYPEKRYRGVVSKVVPTADRAKATVMTKIRFLDLDSRVLPEMSAKVSYLPVENGAAMLSEKPSLVINSAAVLKQEGGSFVFVVKDGKLEKKKVELGPENGPMIVLRSGLTAGDAVVLRPSASFEDGMSVEIEAR